MLPTVACAAQFAVKEEQVNHSGRVVLYSSVPIIPLGNIPGTKQSPRVALYFAFVENLSSFGRVPS